MRETLSEDLMERLIIDILGIAESLMGAFKPFPLAPSSSLINAIGPDHAFSGAAATQPKGITHPDHEHGRPDKDNFDGVGEALEQLAFSSQC